MAIIFITKGKTNWKYILIIVILALIVVGESFLLLRQRINIPETKLPEKVTQDETADWKTYRNEEYGFEIRYPEEFYIRRETTPDWIWIDSDSPSFKNAMITIHIGPKFALSKTEAGGLIYYDEIPKKSTGNILLEDVVINDILFQKDYYVLYGGAGAWSSGINVYTTSRYQGNYYLISLDLYKLEPSPPAEMWDLTRGTAGYLTEKGREWLGREMAKGEGETTKIFNQILSTFTLY